MSDIESESSLPLAKQADTSPPRRALLLGAAGALAAVAGAGFAWWRVGGASAGAQGELPPSGFWDLQLDSPQGKPVLLQGFRGKPLLINFWATWCPPCLEEMPAIQDFFNQNSANGQQVLGLAVDRPVAVQAFMLRTPVAYPIAMAGARSSELLAQLGNPSGALPFSVLLGADGTILQRRLGKLSQSDLQGWARLK
jgi:thiol-disulfide isomerase/thioredoxin